MNEPSSQFIEPWTKEISKIYFEELTKELSREHFLYDEELEVVARRIDKDDVLFKFKKSDDRYVQVHLTWKMDKEINPQWPKSQVYNSLEEWINNVMKIDSKEFKE